MVSYDGEETINYEASKIDWQRVSRRRALLHTFYWKIKKKTIVETCIQSKKRVNQQKEPPLWKRVVISGL